MAWISEDLHLPTGAVARLYSRTVDRPKAVVHVHHGMAEHAARYERFADALAAGGYDTFAHDHRGHGHTTAPGASQGYFGRQGGWDGVCADAEAVRDVIRERCPGVSVVTFGHSMGSILAFNLALRRPAETDALALWNSGVEAGGLAVVFDKILRVQKAFKGSDTPSGLARAATFDTWNKVFAPNRTAFDWLSRDEAEVDAYIADPLCGFPVTIGMWLDVLSGVRFAADDANLPVLSKDLPVHLLAGENDPCSENGAAVRKIADRMNARGMSDITFNLLPNTRHESLNEINRDETTALFIAWLDRHYA